MCGAAAGEADITHTHCSFVVAVSMENTANTQEEGCSKEKDKQNRLLVTLKISAEFAESSARWPLPSASIIKNRNDIYYK